MPKRPATEDYEWIEAPDRASLRAWLVAHHDSSPGIWVVYHKQGSPQTGISYDEAVEEALCFGWIDSKVKKVDEHRYRQLFTPRRPGSVWSRLNKDRVERAVAAGRMTPAGMAKIDAARADGSWSILDGVDALEVPDDLAAALDAVPAARLFFNSLAPSRKRPTLFWVVSAKRPATRASRIATIVAKAAEGKTVQED